MPFTTAFADLDPRERYKLLCATVVPRPIALVTTLGRNGVVNAAPFSFFNVFSEDPPLVVLGLEHKPGPVLKDQTRNIAQSGAFVVNLVDEDLAEAMNVCAFDFPTEVIEIDAAALRLSPGVDVAVPHVAQAPFALECRRTVSLAFGAHRELLVGEVLRLHAREGMIDPYLLRVTDAYRPVGRLFGEAYARQRDRFELKRESFAEWSAARQR